MGCCLSKQTLDHVDYVSLRSNQYDLRKITEVSLETDPDLEAGTEMEAQHI
jgi:hypothetical protein